MIVIGLTGSIGMGKTTTANMLRDMGIPVHCSDDTVHALLARGGVAVAPVTARFPASYDKKNECIDRKKLRDLLAQDHEKFDALEAIIHPLVVESQNNFLREHQGKREKMVVLDIPLLFETGADKRVDTVICVAASPEIQRQRVMARPGMSKEVFDFLRERQCSDQEKRRRSDFIVQTGNGHADTRRHLEKIVRKLRAQGGQVQQNRQKPPECGL